MTGRWAEVVALVLLAWVVAVPLTHWYAHALWVTLEPVAALVVWQAIGLAGGFALLTAELTIAASGDGGRWRDAVRETLADPLSAGVAGVAGLALVCLTTLWLLGVLAVPFVAAARSRRAHRAVLELLSEPAHEHGLSFDVIDAAPRTAYSLPGRTSHVVLSSSARACLGDGELRVVLAHERAHLRQRHSLLVQPFVAWQRSVPLLHAPTVARQRVEALVEMACDDAACRGARRAEEVTLLRSALERLDPAGATTAERLDRLGAYRRSGGVAAGLLAVALLIAVAPPALLVLAG